MEDVEHELQEILEGEDTPSGHPLAVGVGWSQPGDLSSPSWHHTSGRITAGYACAEDAVFSLHLEKQSAFELFGELFHVFISYRVTSEGRKGNAFARNLYKHLHLLSRDDDLSIPSVGCGQYPRFVKEIAPGAIANKPNVAKVYLDEQCLQDGHQWMLGFVKGLSVSMVAVLLVLVPSFPHMCQPHSQSY